MIPAIKIEDINTRLRRTNTDALAGSARLVGILFCRPELPLAKEEVFPSIQHFHLRSGNRIDIFFPGFCTDSEDKSCKLVPLNLQQHGWYFDHKAFNDFLTQFESLSGWASSGGCDLFLANCLFDSAGKPNLDFKSAASIPLEKVQLKVRKLNVSILFEALFKVSGGNEGCDPNWALGPKAKPTNSLTGLCESLLSAACSSDYSAVSNEISVLFGKNTQPTAIQTNPLPSGTTPFPNIPRLTLRFVDKSKPTLRVTEFLPPKRLELPNNPIICTEGKSDEGKFSWGLGTQALCICLIRYLCYDKSQLDSGIRFRFEGSTSQPAKTMDGNIAKAGNTSSWQLNVFGEDGQGKCLLQKYFSRKNSNPTKSKPKYSLEIQDDEFPQSAIKIMLDGKEIADLRGLSRLANAIEDQWHVLSGHKRE